MKKRLLIPVSTIFIFAPFLFSGCDRLAGVDPADPVCIPTTGVSKANCAEPKGDEFVIRFTPEEGTAGLLFSVTGALEDEGRVEGYILRADLIESLPENWRGYRALRGSEGIIVLSFEGTSISKDERVVSGNFKILDHYCTNAYAELQGEGTFRVNFDGNGNRLEELFTGEITPPGS